MNRSSADRLRRRVFRRVAVIVAGLLPAGAIAVAAGQPAQAAQCATNAHVYLTNVSPWAIRYEDQPTNGGFNDYYRPTGQPVSLRVGGNGLKVATGVSWRVESNFELVRSPARCCGSSAAKRDRTASPTRRLSTSRPVGPARSGRSTPAT